MLIDHGRAAHRGTPAELKSLIGSYAEAVLPEDATEPVLLTAAGVLDRLTGAEPVIDRERRTVGAMATGGTLTLPGSSANSTRPGCR